MYWDTGFTSLSPQIEIILSKEDATLVELLDDENILQEVKSQNKKLVQYLNRPEIIEELLMLITTEPSTELEENVRYKHANMACEILTSDVPALNKILVGDEKLLQKLYGFVEQTPPLNPLLTSFFCKTFGMLITRKTEQDWFSYQSVCLLVIEFIKSRDNFLDSMLKHMDMPVIMDLLFNITQVDGADLKNNLYKWLNEQNLIEKLISIFGIAEAENKHCSVAQYVCDIIKTGRTNRQNERQNGGSTDFLLEALEDEKTTKLLLDTILADGSTESSIVGGISILLTLLENPILNEPASDAALQFIMDKEKKHHETVVAQLITVIVTKVNDFHQHLLNPPPMADILTTVALLSPPFGNTRLQICCLITVLIETENSEIINAICETGYFETLVKLFKQYCWNNFLHNQSKKCLTYAFQAFDQNDTALVPSALQKHIIVNCKLPAKLIDCWIHNEENEAQNKGRRLGYMGHLIEMLDALVSSATISNELRALVESSFDDSQLLDDWNRITQNETGNLPIALDIQKRFLANCDPIQTINFENDNISPEKDFLPENYNTGFIDSADNVKLSLPIDFSHMVDDICNSLQNLGNPCSLLSSNAFWGDSNGSLATGDTVINPDKVWSSEATDPDTGGTSNDLDKFDLTKEPSTPWYIDASELGRPHDSSNYWEPDMSLWNNYISDNFADFDAAFASLSENSKSVDSENEIDGAAKLNEAFAAAQVVIDDKLNDNFNAMDPFSSSNTNLFDLSSGIGLDILNGPIVMNTKSSIGDEPTHSVDNADPPSESDVVESAQDISSIKNTITTITSANSNAATTITTVTATDLPSTDMVTDTVDEKTISDSDVTAKTAVASELQLDNGPTLSASSSASSSPSSSSSSPPSPLSPVIGDQK